MTDWRQVRARIRRAKAGPNAAARLEQLFEKTRDGMVAFELAQLEELSGQIDRATDWYKRAWQRFRRAEWKQKAEEALIRHGASLPSPDDNLPGRSAAPHAQPAPAEFHEGGEMNAPPEWEASLAGTVASESAAEMEPRREAAEAPRKQEMPSSPRRRRRGGRGRGRGRARPETLPQPETEADTRSLAHAPPQRTMEPEGKPPAEHHPAREHLPAVQIYRRGEPALASEIKALEAKLRQLLASHPHPMSSVDELPASPGVYLVSDLDLTTMYFLEACGNIRSAIDQLVSGKRGRQGSVRARLARYLKINDTRASRYLKQHCVARWIELEESDALAVGHFARALLRPELMEELD